MHEAMPGGDTPIFDMPSDASPIAAIAQILIRFPLPWYHIRNRRRGNARARSILL